MRIYCKVKTCENVKGVENSRVHMFKFPTDPVAKDAWKKALNGLEYGSSQYVCIDHFVPDDYVVSKDGKRFKLKCNAIPSVFSVEMIEIDESENWDNDHGSYKLNSHNNVGGFETEKNADILNITEAQQLISQNEKLQHEIEKLKREKESQKIIMGARIAYFKKKNQQRQKQIGDLNKQLDELINLSDKLTNEKNITFAKMNDKQNQIIKSLVQKLKATEKYPELLREFCLTMHYHSPRAYQFLRETFNNHLPHSGTIRSWYVNSDLNTAPNVINERCMNVLKKKVIEKAEKGEKLICGVVFDEVNIRKHIQWSNKERKLIGYSSIRKNDTEDGKKNPDVANQALVFMVVAVNDSFQLPVSYYFISSLDADKKMSLVEKLIEQLMDCNVVVSHLTFDGFAANKKMCKLLGAVLNVYSPFFKPYIQIRNERIYIFFDICHMMKLVRNNLSLKETLFDINGNEIHWQYFIDLVRMKDLGFVLTHKMNQSHIDWRRKKMKVDLAVQTLSESTAASMEFLMKKEVAEFYGAEHSIKLIRIFDPLFDVFNTKHDQNENPFKRALSNQNAAEIFAMFAEATKYIKGLKVINDKGKLVRVCNSRIHTGFNGFIINMMSLEMLFQKYVKDLQLTNMLKTYSFQQDPVEIFFGKIRSLNGCNDNPTCEQFSGAFRKLLAYSTIMYSKFSNCQLFDDDYGFKSNILSVSSQRSSVHRLETTDNVTPEDIEEFYEMLDDIPLEHEETELTDGAIASIAGCIEQKMKTKKQFACVRCKRIFDENTKMDEDDCVKSVRPCLSTFYICKQTNRFMKAGMLTGEVDFGIIYHEILQNLDFDELYNQTDFNDHFDHKIFIIRYIVDEYIRIKGTHIAKMSTLNEHKNSLRVKLHKLTHYYGQ